MNKGLSNGLQSVALALIFAPEPFTTPIGIGLLLAVKASKHSSSAPREAPRRINRFEDYYRYGTHMKNGSIGYCVSPIREGQIPHALPKTVRLYDTNEWQSYRKNAYSYLKKTKPQFTGIQKGLLQDLNRGFNRKSY